MSNVSIEAVMAETGLTKRQVMSLTRQRRIPASIVGRTFSMTSGQFERLKRDGIAPELPAAKPTTFIHSIDRKAS
jgi:hypothetical protein